MVDKKSPMQDNLQWLDTPLWIDRAKAGTKARELTTRPGVAAAVYIYSFDMFPSISVNGNCLKNICNTQLSISIINKNKENLHCR